MVYKDMTFCDYNKCEKFGPCHRSLTDEVRQKAHDWWGDIEGEAPICQFAEQPNCFVKKKSKVLETIGIIAGAFIEESNEAMGMI